MDIMVDYWIRIQEAKKDRIHNTAFYKRKNEIVINPGGLVRRVDGDVRVDVARHCQRGSKNIPKKTFMKRLLRDNKFWRFGEKE